MGNNKITPQKDVDKKFYDEIRQIIENDRSAAYASVNSIQVQTYWNIGRRIVEEEQGGESKAIYGTKMIEQLSIVLSKDYPNGFSPRDLRRYRQFYLRFKDLQIWHTRVPNLTWSHFRTLSNMKMA